MFPVTGLHQQSKDDKWIFKTLCNGKKIFKVIEAISLSIEKFKGKLWFHKVIIANHSCLKYSDP